MSFIRGVIDGDGSISDNRISIYGTKALLDWIKIYFDEWIPKTNYKISEVIQIQKHLYSYRIGTNRAKFIFNLFNSLNCYNLERKWNKLKV